jgi:2-oxoglutarate dehydrogenase E2 component (dihydrolipoamide succinyltransferase)
VYQIDVAVNAPEAGTIKEFLAQEEDTVTVGQDLVRLEVGGAPSQSKEAAASEAKEPAPKEQPTSSDIKPVQKDEPSPPKEEKKATPPQEQPQKEAPPPKKPEPKASDAKSTSTPTVGSREERRVCAINIMRVCIMTECCFRLK